MKLFLIYVRDEDFYNLLPRELGGCEPGADRIKVMAFPRSPCWATAGEQASMATRA